MNFPNLYRRSGPEDVLCASGFRARDARHSPGWLVCLAFAIGLLLPWSAQGRSPHHKPFAAVKDSTVGASAVQHNPKAADKSYDLASATWMQFFGESAFIAARQPVKTAMDAMRRIGWLSPDTNVVISMLDARGDFAQFDGQRCSVHINIDHRGSSPVIAALGNLSSSVAFVTAHELAHCRFDTLTPTERIPDRQQLARMGVGSHLIEAVFNALHHPSHEDGSVALLAAYDESLADAAAAIALLKAETSHQRFGTALMKAQSLRFGELSMANRGELPAAEHQGGFVFEAIARQSPKNLNWRYAKRVAMHSVLASSFSMATEPPWFKILTEIDHHQAEKLRQMWRAKAHRLLATRNHKKNQDESLFNAATGDTLLSIDSSHFPAANFNQTPDAALIRWKEIASQSSDSSHPIRPPARARLHSGSTAQTIVARRQLVP